MTSSSPDLRARTSALARAFGLARSVVVAVALPLLAPAACTEVRVEETHASFLNTSCEADRSGGGQQGNGSGGGAQPQSQPSAAVMDTYVVQIFELNDPTLSSAGNDCDVCLASRSNCFLERESCVCGDPVAVSPGTMQTMLKGLRVGLPTNYGSLYCMRVMAVQRSSESEQCACDPNWETADRVRLCAVSNPYAASSLPVKLQVQCTDNRAFSTCLGETAN